LTDCVWRENQIFTAWPDIGCLKRRNKIRSNNAASNKKLAEAQMKLKIMEARKEKQELKNRLPTAERKKSAKGCIFKLLKQEMQKCRRLEGEGGR
jgi:hypothetical protein